MNAERPGANRPAIYVASLADHNAGRLHGAWLAADQEPDELQAATEAMLATSSEPMAEEWAIHDQDNFEGIKIGEFDSFSTVARLAVGIRSYGRAFAHFANWRGTEAATYPAFEASYAGCWMCVTDYVEALVNEPRVDQLIASAVPSELKAYVRFDSAAYARDLQLGGDIYTVDDLHGLHIFERADSCRRQPAVQPSRLLPICNKRRIMEVLLKGVCDATKPKPECGRRNSCPTGRTRLFVALGRREGSDR